jgi:hypothetical protein
LRSCAIFQLAFTAIALREDKSDRVWSFTGDRSLVLECRVSKRPPELNTHGLAHKELAKLVAREVSNFGDGTRSA